MNIYQEIDKYYQLINIIRLLNVKLILFWFNWRIWFQFIFPESSRKNFLCSSFPSHGIQCYIYLERTLKKILVVGKAHEWEKLTSFPSRVGDGGRDTVSYQKGVQGNRPRKLLNFDVLLSKISISACFWPFFKRLFVFI